MQIANIQRQTFDAFLGPDWADIDAAFADFAQGVLISTDPQRLADNNAIHMMDGQDATPPIGFGRWHACIRAIQQLQIGDAAWWDRLATAVGTAWAIQSLARPRQQSVPNPGITVAITGQLATIWHGLSQDRLDLQHDLPQGYHPSPFNPA